MDLFLRIAEGNLCMKKIILRIVGIVVLSVLVAALFVAGCRLFVILSTKDRIRTYEGAVEEVSKEGKFDAVIVLGAAVWRNRTPSPILQARLDTAAELYGLGLAEKIIVTGDYRPGEYGETDVMQEYLIRKKGIPEDRIECDFKGFSTYESMVRTATEFGVRRAIVVTQHYHLYRAMYIAKARGVEIRGVIAENAGNFFQRVQWTAREWMATIKDMFYCMTNKEIPQ